MIKNLMFVVAMLISVWANAQTVSISGKITDKETKKPIGYANIYVQKLKQGTYTDENGNYQLNLPSGKTYKIETSSIGYITDKRVIDTNKGNISLNIELENDINVLETVQIVALKEKVNSVSKIDVAVIDLPVTTSQIGKEFFEQLQVSNLNDALRYATGIKPTVNYGGFQTFKMRGFGAPIIMVDGARDERMNLSNSAPVTSLAAVERLEYLKGPASVLYGHSAVGGVLNIVRKQPTSDFTANFEATYGTWDRKEAKVGSGGQLTNKLNYRFDAQLADNKGWRDYATKVANAYLALDYEMNNNNKLEFRWGANKDFYATETGITVVGNDIYDLNGNMVHKQGDLVDGFKASQRYNDPQDFLKHKNYNLSLKYIHKFKDNSKLTVHTSYSDDLIDYLSTEELSFPTDSNQVYSNYFMSGGKKKYIDLKHFNRSFPFRFSHETRNFQNYVDYNRNFKTGSINHHFLAGYYFMYLDRMSFKSKTTGGDIFGKGLFSKVSIVNPTLNQGDIQSKFSSVSIYYEFINSAYIQDLMDISDKFKVMLNARIDNYNRYYNNGKVLTGRTIVEKDKKINITNTALTYKLGFVYKPIEDFATYASISSFFKPNRTTFNTEHVYINKNGKEFIPKENEEIFKPESGYQIEGGFKYSYEKILDLNIAAYYIKKENITQYLGRTDKGNSIYGQVGAVDSKGIEFDATFRPVKGLSMTAGYTFSQAKYKKFAKNPYMENNNQGNLLVRNPEHQFFMWNYYTVQKGALKNLSIGMGINYTGDMFTDASNSYTLPSYWLTEASIGYSFDNMYLKLKANNILNEKYFSNSVMSNQFIPGEERNFLFTVGYKF